jgi:hypothetical protein
MTKSVYGEYRKRNEYLVELVNISRETELSRKRRADIMDSKKGCKSTTNPSTTISDSIPFSNKFSISSYFGYFTQQIHVWKFHFNLERYYFLCNQSNSKIVSRLNHMKDILDIFLV